MIAKAESHSWSQFRIFRRHTLPQVLSRVISSSDGPIGIVPNSSKSIVYELDTLRAKGHECPETQIFSDSSFTESIIRKTTAEQCQVAKGRFGTIPSDYSGVTRKSNACKAVTP